MSSLPSPLSITFSPPKHLPHFKPCFFSKPYSSSQSSLSKFSLKLKMSSSSQTIEHIVLFKVKENAEPSKVSNMVNGLNALSSMDKVLYLTAGPIIKNISPSFSFTHLLHSRYDCKEDLSHYSSHANHLGVVKETVFPICDDIMVFDWVNSNLNGPLVLKPGSAMRVTLLKLKEGLGDTEKHEVLGITKGLKDYFPSMIEQTSVGENFSPERAKGFSIASMSFCPGFSELEAAESSMSDFLAAQEGNIMQYIESVIGVDYVIPSSH